MLKHKVLAIKKEIEMFFKKLSVVVLWGMLLAFLLLCVFANNNKQDLAWMLAGLIGVSGVILLLCYMTFLSGKKTPFEAAELICDRPYEVLAVWESGPGTYSALFRTLVLIGEEYDPRKHSAIIVELYDVRPSRGYVIPYLTPAHTLSFRAFDGNVSQSKSGYKIAALAEDSAPFVTGMTVVPQP
ncbi:MAG: hypothetical protein WC631_01230 [Candidatus Paceibacterota bacterium]|jgi:hypothetical protein